MSAFYGREQGTILLILTILLPALIEAFILSSAFSKCDSKLQFTCKDATCIQREHLCDKEPHCPDGSDEASSLCDIVLCRTPTYFKCHDGECLHANTTVCDGHSDCSDGSDERNCDTFKEFHDETTTRTRTCPDAHQTCPDGRCISSSSSCDANCGIDESSECDVKKCMDDEFTCIESGHCIPKLYWCNGYRDCTDGSDEHHCNKSSSSVIEHHANDMTGCTKKNRKYACKDHSKCIDEQKVCDGSADCDDSSDEGEICPKSNKNECETYGICDQKCVKTLDSYHCACDPGYILQTDGRTCFVKEGEGTLVYSVKDAIKGLTLKTRIHRAYFEDIPYVVGVSAVGSDLYWTTVRNGSQSIMKATEFKNQETIVTNGLRVPEDVAVDRITGNIYFTDSGYKRIVVCKKDGYICTILHDSVDKPRGIALIPERGLLFWTDWGKIPYIGRSGMDGSNSMEFVSKDLKWPNGLAIDLPNERLYWVDAQMKRVESIKLDQTDRRIILSESVHHPFSLAVFEDRLYWSEFNDKEIHSCNKFTGKERQSITREFYENIHGINIHNPVTEQTQVFNPCVRQPCSALCLLAPDANGFTYKCACPSNQNLAPDSINCLRAYRNPIVLAAEKKKIHFIEHKPIGRSTIRSDHIRKNFHISAMVYNSRKDAVLLADLNTKAIYSWDLTEEFYEPMPMPLITHGLGLISSMQYDSFGNNLYWCDEDSLSVEAISLNTFARSIIVPAGAFSELPVSLALAPKHGFMFIAYVRLYARIHIDKISMDGNEMSRKHLVSVNLAGFDIKLHFNEELKKLFWADTDTGEIESIDIDGNNRVKLFAGESSPHSLTSSGSILFWVNSGSPIINSYNYYVGEYSKLLKLDHSPIESPEDLILSVMDEWDDIGSECVQNNGGCSHLCLASYEKHRIKVCACPAGYSISTDGRTCVKPKSCPLDEFQCFTGECLPMNVVCDNKKDCIHGEDENLQHCNEPKCPAEQFLCFDQSRCVDRKSRCDGHFDCDDKSDEICNINCTKSQFACDSGECIDLQFRCDGKVDCKNAHDELQCISASCDESEFRCSSGQCIPLEWECDKEVDCIDGSDESVTCEQIACFANEFRCNNDKCVDMSLTCNGFNDCGDDSDELQCLPTGHESDAPNHNHYAHKLCSNSEFYCMSNERHCIPISARCNGTRECAEGEDEQHCSDSNPCIPDRQFFCVRDNYCIPIEWVCDNHDDCGDGSDETKHACFHVSKKDETCPGFKCTSGECVALSEVCDSIAHCSDKSDENEKCHITCKELGCSQKCFQTPNGPECRCKLGYERSTSDNITCIDVDECNRNICAQRCTNTIGGFLCECHTPEYRLRADRVSCKALGPSLIYVVASRNMLFTTTDNLKHRSELQLGTHNLFNSILRIDVDSLRNHVYVLLENDIIERVSTTSQDRKQLIAPQATDIAVDWVTEIVYTVHNRESINVINFNVVNEKNENVNIRLYRVHNDSDIISTLSVDPVAGYLFWFEKHIDLFGDVGLIKRADCTGANVITLLSPVMYPVRQMVVDSFNRHLYWFGDGFIHRMNYDGSNDEIVLETDGELISFIFFENSIYSIYADLIPIRKCKIYGLPPKKCELIKLNMHEIRHLSILQQNRQRTVQNSCEEHTCSSYGLCLLSPDGPQCVCPDGKIRTENIICSSTGSLFSNIGNSDSMTFGTCFAYFVILCLFSGLVWISFARFSRRKGDILQRLHFHNPVYDISNIGRTKEALLSAEEHPYENSINEGSKSVDYNDDTCMSERKMYSQTIEESNHNGSTSDYLPASKELLYVNTV